MSSGLVEIEPIEYSKNECRPCFYEKISSNVTVKELNKILSKKKVKRKPRITQNADGSIKYSYPNAPVYIIKDGRIFTTDQDLKKFGKQICQQRASILFRLLYYPRQKGRQLIVEGHRGWVPLTRMPSKRAFLINSSPVYLSGTIKGLQVTLIRIGHDPLNGLFSFGLRVKNVKYDEWIPKTPSALTKDDLANSYQMNSVSQVRRCAIGESTYLSFISMKSVDPLAKNFVLSLLIPFDFTMNVKNIKSFGSNTININFPVTNY